MTAAVYRLYGEDFALLYVGSSRNPKLRMAQHRRKPWWSRVICYRLTEYASTEDALMAERRAIRNEHPEVNTRWKEATDERHPLQVLRERLLMSQAELAYSVGCCEAAVSHWECGREAPYAKRFPVLAEALGVSLGEIAACFPRERTRPTRVLITHCKHGHEYTPENTYIVPKDGSRQCRKCVAANSRAYQERRKNLVRT